jgi:hypothetical protein
MKRYLTFALLFPPIAFVVAFWIMLQILNWAEGGPSSFDYHQVILLPLAYLMGIVPALLTAKADDILSKQGVRYRILWTAFAGYVFIFMPLLAALTMGFVHGPYLLLFGIIGAVPAAVCSWIAGPKATATAVANGGAAIGAA